MSGLAGPLSGTRSPRRPQAMPRGLYGPIGQLRLADVSELVGTYHDAGRLAAWSRDQALPATAPVPVLSPRLC